MGEAAFARFDAKSTAEAVVEGEDLRGLEVLVTGANAGIGLATAEALAGAGARVWLAGRRPEALAAAADQIRSRHPEALLECLILDLASLASIRAGVEAFTAPRCDLLVANAGLVTSRFETTAEGLESTVGICHFGHAALLRLLMTKLLIAPSPRVIMVSSESHRTPARLAFDRFPLKASQFKGLVAYGQAKLCNVLFAKALQRRYGGAGLMACALHPGALVTTSIGRDAPLLRWLVRLAQPFTKSPSQGAATTVLAAVHRPASDLAGAYLSHCRPVACSKEAGSLEVADRLWALTDEWLTAQGLDPWPPLP
ncbi:MAG: SDR family NAD(P)-dependent oxidoreductase [Proteobacteria bacterium]|nr:SDR family NAD(P)-dependent oxidoreductase [Pseudomonadota bacterium]